MKALSLLLGAAGFLIGTLPPLLLTTIASISMTLLLESEAASLAAVLMVHVACLLVGVARIRPLLARPIEPIPIGIFSGLITASLAIPACMIFTGVLVSMAR